MIPQSIKNFLTNKKIILNVIDDREITITEVYDFLAEDRSVGIFGNCACCITSEGNEVGVWDSGDVYSDIDNQLIATIESDFGHTFAPPEPDWND